MHTPPVHKALVNRPNFLTVNSQPRTGYSILTSYRSPVVKSTDPWLEPLRSVLVWSCYFTASQQEHNDAAMMFGIGIEQWYLVLENCPGNFVQHECYARRAADTLFLTKKAAG